MNQHERQTDRLKVNMLLSIWTRDKTKNLQKCQYKASQNDGIVGCQCDVPALVEMSRRFPGNEAEVDRIHHTDSFALC